MRVACFIGGAWKLMLKLRVVVSCEEQMGAEDDAESFVLGG
jgi:hypothetical protein